VGQSKVVQVFLEAIAYPVIQIQLYQLAVHFSRLPTKYRQLERRKQSVLFVIMQQY
jgi:hypothetical protein